MKGKVLIDMRTVKRFRIWQILVLKRKIAIFMRKVKETNKRFLQRNLKVIIEVLKKPIQYSFNKLCAAHQKIQIPKTLSASVAVCKFSITSIKLLAKQVSHCLLPKALPLQSLKIKAFALWKSRAYQASPFLHRNLVLTLSTMGILLKHRWHNLNFAWQKVNQKRKRVETIMLARCIKKISLKKIALAFRKVSQPRFQRKKLENPKKSIEIEEIHVKTGSMLLEMMFRKKKKVDSKEMFMALSRDFYVWKQLSTENSVPNFIMKRHYRNWSLKILVSSMKYLEGKSIFLGFSSLKSLKSHQISKKFPIDKHLIENQALILVRLESQHYSKSKEFSHINRCEKLNKCRVFFWKSLVKWMARWKELLKAPDNLEVIYIQKLFEYLSFLEGQAENDQENVELAEVRAVIERRSTEVMSKLIDSDSSINFRSL